MKKFRLFLAIASLLSLVGCAHPISIAPKDGALDREAQSPVKIKKKVGLYIPAESLNLEVTTPGGGGDNVRYFPYRDLESGYVRMLNNVFEDVVRVAKVDDPSEFDRAGLAYVITPELITNSGSVGYFTWPPTNFTVDLTSKIRGTSGKLLYSSRVIGVGSVKGFSDMNGNFGVTGQLAMKDALEKGQVALFDVLEGDKAGIKDGNTPNPDLTLSISGRLLRLKALLDEKLISNDDYEVKKKEILNSL